MATVPATFPTPEIDYPTSDGRPMAETDHHRDLMIDAIKTLQARYQGDKMVYVSGNLLIYYEEGNKRRHLAPDVFVVKGVPNHRRKYYLMWQEGKGPDVAIELTSSSTKGEDKKKKKLLYRDTLKVPEYFMFDPYGDYLDPRLQGFRLVGGDYVPIGPVNGRLPSEILGLHLEVDGDELRLWDPETAKWLPNPEESKQAEKEARIQAQMELAKKEQERVQAQMELAKKEQERMQAQMELAKKEQERVQAQMELAKKEQERGQAQMELTKKEQERIQAQMERDREIEARQKAENELARLRAQLGLDQGPRPST
jgi:Uma2 family endonuclease